MERRKEVFQSKVLQKLYPAALELEKDPSPAHIVQPLAETTYVKRKASQEDTATGKTQNATNLGRRMYTVLPPPADYKTDSAKSTSHPQEDLAEESVHDNDEELEKDEDQDEQKSKRRRKKRKATLHPDSGKDGAPPESESSSGPSQTRADDGGEHISRNKRRKLKKRRHKEKLRSMGLMPRAAALEFTYQKDGEEEEEEANEMRAAEVSDFLRTTMEIYKSDSMSHVDKLPLQSGTVEDLLSSMACGSKPTSVLKQLSSLKAFVQQKEVDKLEKALEELYNTSPMSAEETTTVVSLFQYWITDILPMQGDKKAGLSTMRP